MADGMILTNARLALGDEIVAGTLSVSASGHILSVDQGGTSARGAVDCGGDLLAPGLIELHTDNLERHLSPRPGVDWPRDAAILAHDSELAGCGVTTVFDALRVGSFRDGRRHSAPYARELATGILGMRSAGNLKISHHLHLRAEICSETLMEELDGFSTADRVGILSIMNHTPGQRQFADIARYRRYMTGKHGLTEAEVDSSLENLRNLESRVGERHEDAAVAAAARLGATLASHDDTEPHHVDRSASRGVRVAEFPTTLRAAEACRRAGMAVMMGAPNMVRGESHSGNVSASELAGEGLLDMLSSDYAPSSLLLGAARLARIKGDLAGALAAVTSAPAAAAGFGDRGRIAEGLRADLVRVREVGEFLRPVSSWCLGRRVS